MTRALDPYPLRPGEGALVETALAFTRRHVAPNADSWEREARPIPRHVVQAFAECGLLGLETATRLGGRGASFAAKVAVVEAIAGTCMASSFALVNAHNGVARMARDGSPAQVERRLPALLAGERIAAVALTEPGAGSDFANIATTARRVAGGWQLDGEKAWITNAAIADEALVYAQTEPGSRGAGIAGFLVDADRPGFERVPHGRLLGGHAIGAAGIRLSSYFVPDEDLFYPPGGAFRKALASINGARTYVAAMCCAMVEASLRRAVAHAGKRTAFGRPLIEHQGIGWMLADVATDLEAARLLTIHAAELVESGADARIAAAHAKKFAARIAERRIRDCVQAMGAEGLREEHGLGRHLAGARIANYVDGTTEMQNERLAAELTRQYGG